MWFALFSIIFYILSLLLIAPFLMNSSEGKLSQSKTPFFLTALAAIILHVVSTFPLLEDLASGQSFTLMEIASLMSVIIAALATLSMFLVSTMWFVLPLVYAVSYTHLDVYKRQLECVGNLVSNLLCRASIFESIG